MEPTHDTIAAIATACGGGVGMIRLSGPEAFSIADTHFRPLPESPKPRHVYHGWWHDADGTSLDEGLLVRMPGPASYTGEDVVEIHLHGGALNMQRCLDVCWVHGVRPAGPGEFTKRAFLNGRLDLTKAEAVADMVSARTEQGLAQAREHLKGRLAERVMDARERLLNLRAKLEVNIDFVDEDVPLMAPEGLRADALEVARDLTALAETWHRGHLWRQGARVVLSGPPNTGKSTLFNALCDKERAIVTEVPGTTRDSLDETIDLLGIPVVIVDTAGLRETEEVVESAGIDRTHEQIAMADVVVRLWEPQEDGFEELDASQRGNEVWVISKCDLPSRPTFQGAIHISGKTGDGLDKLIRAIVEKLGGGMDDSDGDSLTIGRVRHRVALMNAASALEMAAAGLHKASPAELVAVDIQEATDCLTELVGVTTIDDMLDRLFGAFCIGK